jgi:hypothetical protein
VNRAPAVPAWLESLRRGLAVFAVAYLAAAFVMPSVVPRLMRWYAPHCLQGPEFAAACAPARVLLEYWWLALVPVLAAVSWLACLAWKRVARPPASLR